MEKWSMLQTQAKIFVKSVLMNVLSAMEQVKQNAQNVRLLEALLISSIPSQMFVKAYVLKDFMAKYKVSHAYHAKKLVPLAMALLQTVLNATM